MHRADMRRRPPLQYVQQTNAERHIADHGGQWRVARKDHRCDRYFGPCQGDGTIHKGERYFDTHDLREYTKGPVPYRVCCACAEQQ